MRTLTAAALILLTIFSATAGADELVNLAASSTYKIKAEGHCFSGQTQVGTNIQAGSKALYIASPVMEQDDDGDDLIDGKHDPANSIATWYWSNQAKRVFLTFFLAGESTLHQVAVHLEGSDSATVHTRLGSGNWTKWASGKADKLTADPVSCDQVRIHLSTGTTPNLTVSEVELLGQGPTDAEQTGLLRQPSHRDSVVLDELKLRSDSVLLTDRKNHPSARLRPASQPVRGTKKLLDNDLTSGIIVTHKQWLGTSATLTIDLKRIAQIDRIEIWLPGTNKSYVNELRVAAGATTKPGDWRAPCDMIRNPYWPSDNVDEPYSIVTPLFDVPARYIRVDAALNSRIHRPLGVSEIRVWGKFLDDPTETFSGKFDSTPIKIKPEPRKKISSGLSWIDEQGVRLAWGGVGGDPHEILAKFKDAGFNIFLLNFTGRMNREKYFQGITAWGKAAHDVGIALIVGRQYGSDQHEPYRRFRALSGEPGKRSCCPLDYEYMQRHVTQHLEDALDFACKDGYRIDGYHTDYEMYESDSAHYPSVCICDVCFKTYLDRFSKNAQYLFEQIEPHRRGTWLHVNSLSTHYHTFFELRIQQFYETLERKAHAVKPEFLFSYAPWFRMIAGLTRGFGTPEVPCLALSEWEYKKGVTEEALAKNEMLQREGYPGIYVPGLWVRQYQPEQFKKHLITGVSRGKGWWCWPASALYRNPGKHETQGTTYGRADNTSSEEYFQAIKEGHKYAQQLREKAK